MTLKDREDESRDLESGAARAEMEAEKARADEAHAKAKRAMAEESRRDDYELPPMTFIWNYNDGRPPLVIRCGYDATSGQRLTI